eukprot:Gb_23646 [translate_table: standard]
MPEVELPEIVSLGQSLLSRLLEVAGFARNVRVEKENFLQLAWYLETISAVVIELQKGRDSSPLIREILEALLRDVEVANQLVHICTSKSRIYSVTQSKNLVKQLENVVHDLGRSLHLVPLSSVQNHENTKVTIDSLSQQMQKAYFHVTEVQESTSHSLKGNMLNSRELSFDHGSQSDDSHNHEQRRIEPLYEAFVCPLTKQIMQDPVTLENGQTYERSSIERWFKECQENGRKPVCPMTGKELRSTELNPSIALRNTIEEWTARNEGAQIDIAYSLLSQVSPEEDVLNALKDVQHLCQKNRSNKHRVRNTGLIPKIVDQLKIGGEKVRCRALETLCVLSEDDEDNKEAIAETDAIRSFVKCLSRELSQEREEAVSLLLELSKSESLCEKIGSVNGAILILVGMTSSKSEHILAVEKADKTLENLEKCDRNVRQMAENGRLQPLLTRLVEGSEETQMEMANYLGDVVLSNDGKTFVAEMAARTLVNIMGSGRLPAREAALKALNQISSYEANGKILIEAGILPPLIKDLFTVGVNQLPMKMKEVSATVLANVVNSNFEFESAPIDADGHTLVSENIIHNLLHLISNTGPAIEAKLLQVLVGLANSSEAVLNVVEAIKSAGATISLIQFIEAPQKDLRIASVKLLQRLCPHMGQELADGLRVTSGQLGTLIKIMGSNGMTEEHAAAANLVANLPVMDAILTRSLLAEGAFPVIVSRIDVVRHGEMRGSRFLTPYLEGLVGILARFTFLLDDVEVLALGKEYNLASLFTDLLQTNGLDEVQRLSAVALENLSAQSKKLSEFPEISNGGFCATFFSCLHSPPKPTGLCPVHHGICSSRDTFCLLEARAVTKLVACLDHANVFVVEASLAAICTLVNDSVDVERGVQILDKAEAITPILDILQEHKTEVLRQRAVWTVERILRTGDLARAIASDPNVHTALVDAFRYGNYNTRQVAEKALKHLNKIPHFSGVFHKIG